jgi:uncharacterized linocin/CFP29 family protein
MSQLNWTEAQWNRVNSAITEEFTKASVAGACLPCYGPVGASMEVVSKQQLTPDTDNPSIIKVSDKETTPFWTIRTYVHLNSQQVADENLSSALFAFKRAANRLARTEDFIVFLGYDTETKSPANAAKIPDQDRPDAPEIIRDFIANEKHQAEGLFTHKDVKVISPQKALQGVDSQPLVVAGERLVTTIADAIANLEDMGYPGPFASVLGRNLYIVAHTPSKDSMVLPADRITPMLGGPLLRSGSMLKSQGIVASTCGESLDIVVATPPKAQFLHVNEDAKYVFRVYERFVLRIKDPRAVVSISLE